MVVDEHKSNLNQVVAVCLYPQTDSSVALLPFRTLSRRIIKFTSCLCLFLLTVSSQEAHKILIISQVLKLCTLVFFTGSEVSETNAWDRLEVFD